MESGGKIVGSGTSGAGATCTAAAAAVGLRPTCAFTVPSVQRQHQSDEVTTSTSSRSAAATTSMAPPTPTQTESGTSCDAAAATGSSCASYTTSESGSADGNDKDNNASESIRDTRRSALNATTGTGADTGAPVAVAGIGTKESSVCYTRTAKVAKFRTSDHGSHGITDRSPDPRSGSVADSTSSTNSSSDDRILKRMTQSLTTTYEGLGQHMVEQQISTCKSSGATFVATLQQHRSSKSPSPGGGAFRSSKKRMSPSADSYDLRPAAAAEASDTVGVMARERVAGAQQEADASRKASPLRSRLTAAATASASATASSSTTITPTSQEKDGGINTMKASSAGTVDPMAATSDTGSLTDAVDARRSSEVTENYQSQDLSKKRRGQLHAELQKGTAEEEAKSLSEPARPLAVVAAPSSSKVLPVESTSIGHHAGDGAGSGPSSVLVTVESTSSSTSETNNKEKKMQSGGKDEVSSCGKDDCSNINRSTNKKNKDKNKEQCLTNPSVPAANGGLDNVDGNLIVCVGAILQVPNRNVQVNKRRVGKVNTNGGAADDGLATISREDDNIIDIDDETVTDYEVLGLLGQGTFAQVFKCRVSGSGEIVAVKVVKNKPAYTRQAAVEIDVFRALSKEPPSAWSEDEKAEKARNRKVGRSKSAAGTEIESPQLRRKNLRNDEVRSDFSDSGSTSMVDLLCYFMYKSHLCLVFELLGSNLYEVLKKRQFRGLPLVAVQSLVRQALMAVKECSCRNIVHADLKPENILLVDENSIDILADSGGGGSTKDSSDGTTKDASDKFDSSTCTGGQGKQQTEIAKGERIKLIDFGSACFEGKSAHTYIQSRFYRSPEVLVGLEYDAAIDMWSLGCVAAELFLGLPILPGVHEHDQLSRIGEMIGDLPDWMLDQGSKASKYFVKFIPKSSTQIGRRAPGAEIAQSPPPRPAWRLKTRDEYIKSLSAEETKRRGGVAKLEQQPTNRYFKRKTLEDIIELHGHNGSSEDKDKIGLFVHFLKGVLDPDPWKRWTANQASMHPFVSGSTIYRQGSELGLLPGTGQSSGGPRRNEISWNPPWDSSICKRKLLAVQKAREKQPGLLRSSRGAFSSGTSLSHQHLPEGSATHAPASGLGQALENYAAGRGRGAAVAVSHASPGYAATSSVTAMTDAMSLTQPLDAQSVMENQYSSGLLINESSTQQSDTGGMGIPNYHSVRAGSLGTALGGEAMTYGVGNRMVVEPVGRTRLHAGGVGLTQNAMQQVGADGLVGSAHPSGFVTQGVHQGDFYEPPNNFPLGTGAQSLSGVYYDRDTRHHVPVRGDLGYALQRPGVVPGVSGDSLASFPSHLTPLQYLQHEQLQQRTQISQSRSIGTAGSSQQSEEGSTRGQSLQGIQQASLMTASTLGGTTAPHSTQQPMSPRFAPPGLLGQQLADHSSAAANGDGGGVRNDADNVSFPPPSTFDNLVGHTAGSLDDNYMSYLSASGTPLMLSAPSTMPPGVVFFPPQPQASFPQSGPHNAIYTQAYSMEFQQQLHQQQYHERLSQQQQQQQQQQNQRSPRGAEISPSVVASRLTKSRQRGAPNHPPPPVGSFRGASM